METIHIGDRDKGQLFEIPLSLYKQVRKKYSNLFDLIIDTESLDNDERQYWLDILDSMSDNQLKSFHTMLDYESKEIRKIQDNYQKQVKEFNENHLKNWKEK